MTDPRRPLPRLAALVSIAFIAWTSSGVAAAARQEETPEERARVLVEQLEGDQFEDAIAALLRVPPAATVPALLTYLESAPAPKAWRAMRALRAVSASAPRERAFDGMPARFEDLFEEPEADLDQRVVLALALGASRRRAKDAAELLHGSLRAAEPELRLAAGLAIAELGGDAAKELKKEIARGGYLDRLFLLSAVAAMGEAGDVVERDLVKLLREEDRVQSYLLCRATRFAAERVGARRVADAWEERETLESKRAWSFGPLNLGGVISPDAIGALTAICSLSEEKWDFARFSVPRERSAALAPWHYSLGDALLDISLHLAKEVVRFHETIARDGWKTYEDWRSATDGIVYLTSALMILEPPEEKKKR